MLKKLALLFFSAVSLFGMHSVEININDKDLELGIAFDLGQYNNNIDPATVFVGLNLIKAGNKYSDANSAQDLEALYEVNFLMKRELSLEGLSLGLGIKINHTENFTSIPLGLELGYRIDTIVPLYLGGSIYYAPEVLSIDDTKDYFEVRTYIDAEVIQHGTITLGYRYINTNYSLSGKSLNFNYNNAAYIGFKFAF